MSSNCTGHIHLWRILKEKLEVLTLEHNALEALRVAERLVAVARRAFPERDLSLAESVEMLAALYQQTGRWNDAEALYREAFKINRAQEGEGRASAALRTGSALASLCASGDALEEAVHI